MLRPSKIAVSVGLTAFFGLAGAGVAFAVSGGSSSNSSSSSSPTSTTVPGSGRHGIRMAGPPMGVIGVGGPGLGGNVVHAQYTVKSGTSYKTIDVQVGSVSAVSSTSITVVSADGFSATYAVQPSTEVDSQAGGIAAVVKSDQVRIQASVSGSSATATSIIDTTKIGASRQGFGLPASGPWAGPGGPRAPGVKGGPPASSAEFQPT